MRDPDRIPAILARVYTVWKKHPDLRLGQLFVNLCSDMGVLYNVEDERLIEALEKFYRFDEK